MDPALQETAAKTDEVAAVSKNDNEHGSAAAAIPVSEHVLDHAITASSSKSGQEESAKEAGTVVTAESQNHDDQVAEAILQADEAVELKAVETLENAYMDVDLPLQVEPAASAEIKEAAHIQAEGMADAVTQQSQLLPHSAAPAATASANGGETREVKVEKMDESLLPATAQPTTTEDVQLDDDAPAPADIPEQPIDDPAPFPSVVEQPEITEHEPPTPRSVAGSISTLSTVDEGPANESGNAEPSQATSATSSSSRSAPASTRTQRKSVTRGSSNTAKDDSALPPPSSGKRSSGRTTSEKPVSSSSTNGSRTRASAAAAAASTSSGSSTTRSSGRASSNKPASKDDSSSKVSTSRTRVRKQSSNMSLRTTRGSASGKSAAGDVSNEMDLSTDINEDPEVEEEAEAEHEIEVENENDGDEGITRCICGSTDDDAPEFMIQCETCRVWQHGPCVGFQEESACPDTYYCEQCRPDLHPTLTKRKKHGRSASASSKAGLTGANDRETSSKPVSRDQAHHREPSHPTPPLPHSASFGSSSSSALGGRQRASADTSVINERKKGSPSPAAGGAGRARSPSHGSESPGPMSADGKRPMYPSTSHLSGPLQPKRRSTMNSRESAAFDESLMLANANAIKESRAMAMGIATGTGGFPSSAAFPAYGASNSGDLQASRGRKRRRKEDSSEREESEDNAAVANQSTSTTHSGKEGMDVVKEEDETMEEDNATTAKQEHTGLAAVKDTIEEYKEQEEAQHGEESKDAAQEGPEHAEEVPEAEAEEIQEVYDEAGDESLSLAQPAKKRRKRRGIGMTATARTKKAALAAKARQQLQAIKVDEENMLLEGSGNGNGLESDAVPDTPIETDEQNQRKRKRMAEGGDEELPARAASPTASTATTETTTSSDKPLAASKKSRPSPPSHPSLGNGSDTSALQPSDSLQTQTILIDPSSSQGPLRLEPLQVNNLAIMSDLPQSNAPSPTGSTSTTTTGLNGQAKERENGMLFPPSVNGRKKPGPKPASQVEETEEDADSASGSAAPFSKGRAGHSRGRGGGPGSRGGKGSPSKRGGHAHAAAEARKGFRGDTPNTDDFYYLPPSWGLPDHLSHLKDLLPSPVPLPLQVPVYIRSPAPSAAPSPVEAVNPATVPMAEASTSGSSSNGATSANVEPVTVSHAEPRTKIRFPPRRMSAAEMRKRSKNILDYLAYCQLETVDRNSRTAALGLQGIQASGPNTPSASARNSQDTPTPQSMLMMDDLSRQLISFQERFL